MRTLSYFCTLHFILDGHVRIWSIDAILNADDPTYSKPRQLASLSHHSGTIHTVRFAPNNRYLASGADDKIVCIYALEPGPPPGASAFGALPFLPRFSHARLVARYLSLCTSRIERVAAGGELARL
jgi:WD40 repeat protein